MKDYRLTTVTYGTSSASFLATRCLNQLAIEGQQEHPAAASAVLNCFYVDDFLGGGATVEEAKELRSNVDKLLADGHFKLRKWASNNEEVMQDIPIEDREMSWPCSLTKDESIKTLGIVWHPASDEFQFQINVKQSPDPLTKRIALSIIASIYDPLGLLGPVIVRCKIILQCLWQASLGWDDPLSSCTAMSDELNDIFGNLPCLSDIRVRRKVIPFHNPKSI